MIVGARRIAVVPADANAPAARGFHPTTDPAITSVDDPTRPTMPVTPDVPNLPSAIVNGAREFHVTAQVFQQQLETILDFTPDKPGKWRFHCHFPHHTANQMESGPEGSPLGMSRVFDVAP